MGKGKFTISEKILDSVTQAPVYYATIAVFQSDSTKPVNGTTADEKGTSLLL